MALDTATSPTATRSPLRSWTLWVVILLAAALIAAGGYFAGQHHSDVQTATVKAYLGDNVTSFQLGADTQGFMLDTVAWTDANGEFHQPGDVPDCLSRVSSNAAIRVSWVPVVNADGVPWDQFIWVDCRATHYTS